VRRKGRWPWRVLSGSGGGGGGGGGVGTA